MRISRAATSIFIIFALGLPQTNVFAEKQQEKKSGGINLKELALPSEVQEIGKRGGSIYYSPIIKDKVLIPVHFWGEVKRTGLHFLPLGTNLVEGISIAGGASSQAEMDNIRLTRRSEEGKSKDMYFDFTKGGDSRAFNTKLQPRDAIFIERSTFHQDRQYYTALVGVISTVLSTVLIIDRIKE